MHRIPGILRENSLVGIAIVLPDGGFHDVNSEFCRLLGYSKEELLATDFQSITHPDSLAPDVNQYRRVMAGEIHQYTMEKIYIHGQTEQPIWARLLAKGNFHPDGSFAYFVSQITEISDKRLSDSDRFQLQRIITGLEADQFFLEYQPIVHFATGETVGFEALSRWRTFDGTVVYPGDFIPLLQSTQNVHRLCHRVIEQVAIAQPTVPQWLSVNICPLTIARPDWGERSESFPTKSHLEILESSQIEGDVEARLEEIRGKGVVLALDDFGTGYAGYSRLLGKKVDAIKLDASLTQNLPALESLVLCESLITMAHKLGMTCIAEGVETEAQAKALISLGCDLGQGWLYGKPGALISAAPN